jgi:hypothetical protein
LPLWIENNIVIDNICSTTILTIGVVLFLVVCVYQIDKLNCMNYNTCSIRLHMLLMRSEFWGMVDRFKPNPRASNIKCFVEFYVYFL